MPDNKYKFIASRYGGRIETALLKAWAEIRSVVKQKELTELISNFGVDGVYTYLSGLNIEGIIDQNITDELNAAITESGRLNHTLLPKGAVTDSVFRFNMLSYQASNYVQNYELNLIREISNKTREAIRQSINADVLAGNNPISTARNFRNTIGLTPKQEQAVRNFRNMLEEGDSQTLKRKLRDKRFDPTIKRSIDTGKPMSQTKVDAMVKRYRERYIKYRAETIARTESLRSISVGQYISTLQAVEEDSVDTDKLRRIWVWTNDKRTRDAHRNVNTLNPEGVRVDQPFTTELGPLMFPRDPNGSATNTINCRCGVKFKIVEGE